MIQLKVCGNTTSQNIAQVAAIKPLYMGFIFYEGSPRTAIGKINTKVMLEIDKSILKVGVFVNENTQRIVKLYNKYDLQYVQLHGNESVEQCAELQRHDIRVIKAFGITQTSDFALCATYAPYCNYFLFDTHCKLYGGSGRTFDWNVLQHYTQEVPFFLAGGIGIENITSALRIQHPKLHALDLNSKLESSAGIKDLKKLKQLQKIIYDN